MTKIRINKYLALCGVASRRSAEEKIVSGKVLINNKKAVIGQIVDTEKDTVVYDGTLIKPEEAFEYYILNKPLDIISTSKDEYHRGNVVSMVISGVRLFPVGRLDRNSTGLILLTNDGDLALKLTHPRYHIQKTYEVTTYEEVDNTHIDKLTNGIYIDGQKTLPANVVQTGNRSFNITIFQGLKRQIRRMCDEIGLSVKTLKRVSMGSIKLGNLKIGEYRKLNQGEVENLKNELENKDEAKDARIKENYGNRAYKRKSFGNSISRNKKTKRRF